MYVVRLMTANGNVRFLTGGEAWTKNIDLAVKFETFEEADSEASMFIGAFAQEISVPNHQQQVAFHVDGTPFEREW